MLAIYRFGDFTLDAGRQELRRGGEPVHLGPLTYRLLLVLVERAPNLVSHDALAESVWDKRPVSPETIGQRVKLLREAMGDQAQHPRYVELVRGRGYRLIPPVHPLAGKPGARRLPSITLAALLAIAAVTAAWLLARPDPPLAAEQSIAVLPFTDLSPGQDQEYFADGVAEEILTALSRSTGLRVIARTSSFSFRGRNVDIRTIANKLGVSHVLEGSVRKSENRVRVTARLVSVADQSRVWADTYDREISNTIGLQDEIAAAVAAALEVNLLRGDPSERMEARRAVPPDAFDSYLRGRQQLRIHSKPSFAEAELHFKRAIEIHPAFLPAYGSLGHVYVMQIMDVQAPLSETVAKLRRVVEEGLAISSHDPGLIGLRAQLARYDGNIELAERRFKTALNLDPTNVPVLQLYATFKLDQSRPREALRIAYRLLEFDPLNAPVYITIWACHMDLWNAPDALAAAATYGELATPNDDSGIFMSFYSRLFLLGDVAGAGRDAAKAFNQFTNGATGSLATPELHYYLGDGEKGDEALRIMEGFFSVEGSTFLVATAYRHLMMGEIAEARELGLQLFTNREGFSAFYHDRIITRLAVDALLERGEPGRAIRLIEEMAPVYARYRTQAYVHPQDFTPAPYPVKGYYSSYPALHFPDYIRALRAAGDAIGAANMLAHMQAILQLRRDRGLLVEGRHVAEALALHADFEAALDALEQGQRDGTLYHSWHLFLLHNEIFRDIRQHPRFKALLRTVTEEMGRQREAFLAWQEEQDSAL
jgi:TolB-like protein/DNA-binding winged helix-turn-helix (wHTH) protein